MVVVQWSGYSPSSLMILVQIQLSVLHLEKKKINEKEAWLANLKERIVLFITISLLFILLSTNFAQNIELLSDLGTWSVAMKNNFGRNLFTKTFDIFEADPNFGEQNTFCSVIDTLIDNSIFSV